MAVLAGIGLAAQAPAFAGQRQPWLADDRNGEIEIGRSRLALGVQRELVIAGRRVAWQGHRGFDVLRFSCLDRNAGELLAAIGLGEGDLEVLRRVGAEIDRGVASAVIRDGHPELERGRRGAAQRREVGRKFELRRELLPDRDGDRQFEIASVTLGIDEKMVFAGSGTGRRLEPQLQLLFRIGRHDRRLDRLPAAENCCLPALRDLRHR